MPYKSKAQMRLFFAKENEGALPKGTARRWAHETKNRKKLPEHVKKAFWEGFEKIAESTPDRIKKMYTDDVKERMIKEHVGSLPPAASPIGLRKWLRMGPKKEKHVLLFPDGDRRSTKAPGHGSFVLVTHRDDDGSHYSALGKMAFWSGLLKEAARKNQQARARSHYIPKDSFKQIQRRMVRKSRMYYA